MINIIITIAVVIISALIFVMLVMMIFGALANRYQTKRSMKKKIYIAGKVTGEPIAECTMKFGTAQKKWEAKGYEVVNPLEVVGSFNVKWKPAMKLCIKALVDCDEVYFLKDWQMSPGAILEHKIAEELDILITYE